MTIKKVSVKSALRSYKIFKMEDFCFKIRLSALSPLSNSRFLCSLLALNVGIYALERLRPKEYSVIQAHRIGISLDSVVHGNIYSCPCGPIPSQSDETKENRILRVCITECSSCHVSIININTEMSTGFLFIKTHKMNLTNCDVVVHIVQDKELLRQSCPGKCSPPTTIIPYDWLVNRQNDTLAITCSLTFGMIAHSSTDLNRNKIRSSNSKYRDNFLLSLVSRLIAECNEQSKLSSLINMKIKNNRRRIYGLIIWVGSKARADVSHQQETVLHSAPFHGREAVIGWIVDDEIFGCRAGTTVCLKADKNGVHLPLMPLTELGDPECDFGWVCAQRRPLRALAHALTLFDPDFVLLADDDSYFNYKLLQTRLHSYILNEMASEPIILGNYLLPRPNELSPKGFFFGGAGYLLGRAALLALIAHEVVAGDTDSASSIARNSLTKSSQSTSQSSSKHSSQSKHHSSRNGLPSHSAVLSLFKEAKEASDIACPGTCILSSIPDSKGFIPLGVRLIDLCVHLLSGENTCHHSDHAVSRCFFYGFHSSPRHIPCLFQATSDEVKAQGPFMCGHVSPCNLSTHLTCHRWKPASMDDITPIRTYLTASNTTEWIGCRPGKYK
eukprot:gene5485-11032_t